MTRRTYDWLNSAGAQRPVRSGVGGIVLFVAAPMLAVLGTIAIVLSFFEFLRFFSFAGTYNQATLALGYFAGVLCAIAALIYATVRLVFYGKRLRAKDGLRVLQEDSRAPVIFLRSFFEDYRRQELDPVGTTTGGQKAKRLGDTASGFKVRTTHEVRLARAFARLGPFVAVGRPSDQLAPLGAARLYVADEHWRGAVAGLVDVAKAIVIQPDTTPGTRWELQLVSNQDLRRVLMIVPDPSLRPLAYAKIRDLVALMLPRPLPAAPPQCEAFMFDDGINPRPILISSGAGSGLRPFIDQISSLEEP